MIKLRDISVKYGNNEIYKDFSFDFCDGVNVILGKSGSGKTTLLNVIADLIEHEGKCDVDKAAMVFQTPCLSPVSVKNNVKLVVDGKDDGKIDEVLRVAQIYDSRDEKATRLSGGEQQRVSLAMAFASDAPVLLLDEPFKSLDYGTRNKLYETLTDLLATYNKTVLLVTHDVDDALALADRIYLLKDRPCVLTQVAEIQTPRNERAEYSDEAIAIRKELQQLLK